MNVIVKLRDKKFKITEFREFKIILESTIKNNPEYLFTQDYFYSSLCVSCVSSGFFSSGT